MNDEDQFDENEVYDILRNERRRHVLRYLRTNGDVASIGDLADAIAETETGESPPPSDSRQSVYVSLHQTHLPKLDNLGVIEYDREERTVSLRPRADQIVARLEGASDEHREVARRFALVVLAVALGTLVLLVGTAATAPGVAAPVAAVGLLVVAAVAALRYRTFSAEE
jgi:hypothetical protein